VRFKCNIKKIVATLALSAFLLPIAAQPAFAVNNFPGGPGLVSDNDPNNAYIDGRTTQGDQARYAEQLKNDPDAGARALTNFLREPNNVSINDRPYIVALRNASKDTIDAIRRSRSFDSNLLASVMSDPKAKAELRKLFKDPNAIFSALAALTPTSGTSGGTGGTTVSNAASAYSSPKQSSLYQTLLPSIIYSVNNGNKSAGSARLALEDIEKYGTTGAGGTRARYGFVQKQDKKQQQGTQLANYIKALYEYDYLVPFPKTSNDTNPVSRFFQNVIRYVETGGSYTPSGLALKGATLFAMIYDATTSLLKGLFDGITSVNWAVLLGFLPGKGSDQKSLLGGILQWLVDTLGISDGLFIVMRMFVIAILLISFIIALLTAFGSRQRSRAMKTLANFAVRIVVIFIFIPASGVFVNVLTSMANQVSEDFTLPNIINSMYVLDTLDWAATTNLSFAPAVSGAPSGGSLGDISKYEPSVKTVPKLAQNVISRAEAAGFTKDKTSAADLLSKVSSQETVSVNAYLSRISSSQGGVGAGSVAAASLPSQASELLNPDGSPAEEGGSAPDKLMFLSEREKDEDKKGSAKKDDKAEAISEWNIGSNAPLKLTSESEMVVNPINWYNLDTYIYGARMPDALSPQHATFANFINSTGTSQIKDPKTGKDPSDSTMKGQLIANANTIAVYNQYAGVSNISGGGDPSLSTQSVAFLLQSDYSNGALSYRGFNTVATKTGETKNTGVNGNYFVRYVIPNSSNTDLITKVYSLVTLWMCAAAVAVYSLIWVLKGPIIGSMFKAASSFLKAAFTGDITAAIRFLAFDTASKFSVSFAAMGSFIVLSIMKSLIDVAAKNPIAQVNDNLSNIPILGDFFGSNVAMVGSLIVATFLVIGLLWPLMTLHLGARGKGTQLKAGFLGIIIMIPYILAESLDEYLDVMYQRIYGKSKSRTFGAKLQNQMSPIDHKQTAKNLGKNVATAAAKVGVGALTGGVGTAALGVAKAGAMGLAGKAAGNLMKGAGGLAGVGGQALETAANMFGGAPKIGKDGMLDAANLDPNSPFAKMRSAANALKESGAEMTDQGAEISANAGNRFGTGIHDALIEASEVRQAKKDAFDDVNRYAGLTRDEKLQLHEKDQYDKQPDFVKEYAEAAASVEAYVKAAGGDIDKLRPEIVRTDTVLNPQTGEPMLVDVVKMPKVDEDGNIVTDDLGNKQYVEIQLPRQFTDSEFMPQTTQPEHEVIRTETILDPVTREPLVVDVVKMPKVDENNQPVFDEEGRQQFVEVQIPHQTTEEDLVKEKETIKELKESNFKELSDSKEFREMATSEQFKEVARSEQFKEFTKSEEFSKFMETKDTTQLKEFKQLAESKEFKQLAESKEFQSFTQSNEFKQFMETKELLKERETHVEKQKETIQAQNASIGNVNAANTSGAKIDPASVNDLKDALKQNPSNLLDAMKQVRDAVLLSQAIKPQSQAIEIKQDPAKIEVKHEPVKVDITGKTESAPAQAPNGNQPLYVKTESGESKINPDAVLNKLNEAILSMKDVSNRPIHVSDMERKYESSQLRQANVDAIEKLAGKLQTAMTQRDTIKVKFDQVEGMRAKIDSQVNPDLANKLDATLNQLSGALAKSNAAVESIATRAANSQKVNELAMMDKVAASLDKAVHTGISGGMVHMGVALRDLANGTDNAKSLRDDWDRRTNPHGESKEQYKARTEASREADKSALDAKVVADLQNAINRLTDETAYTNDLLNAPRR